MRKSNQEIKDKTAINQILSCANICRVAMMDGTQPYVLPFNFGYAHGSIYIHSAPDGKKIELLKENPTVCFEIEDTVTIVKHEQACQWSTLYRSAVGYGKVTFVPNTEPKIQALKIIMNQHGALENPEFSARYIDSVIIWRIDITSITAKQSGNWNSIYERSKLNLASERLMLKEITWDHLEEIHSLHSCPEVDEFNTLGIPAGIEETRRHVRSMIEEQNSYPRKSYTWIISEKNSNAFIGISGLLFSNDKFKLGEIYYKLFPSEWGKGYATEVAKKLIQTGFQNFRLHKIEAGVATNNTRSIRVLEKAGMIREGLRRKMLPIRGKWVDSYHYAIVADD